MELRKVSRGPVSTDLAWGRDTKDAKVSDTEVSARAVVEGEYRAWVGAVAKGRWHKPELVKCLRSAAQYGNVEDVHRYSQSAKKSEVLQSLQEAVLRPHAYCVKALFEHFPRALTDEEYQAGVPKSVSSKPVLHCSVEGGDVECVDLVLKHMDPNLPFPTDEYGRSGLHIAAQLGHLMTLKHLLAWGVDVNTTDQEGQTALHYAALAGTPAVVSFLLANGSDSTSGNSNGVLPAHLAAHRGHQSVLKELRAYHTPLDEACNRGATPVDYAESGKRDEAARMLKEWSAVGWPSVFRLTWLTRLTPVPSHMVAAIVWWLMMAFALIGLFVFPWEVAFFNYLGIVFSLGLVSVYRGEDHPMWIRPRPSVRQWWSILNYFHFSFGAVCYCVCFKHNYETHAQDPLFLAAVFAGWLHFYHMILVRRMDPGTVCHRKDDIPRLLEDIQAQAKGNHERTTLKDFCPTCWVFRPARAKHCKDCGKCIRVLDHHCVFFCGCVGEASRAAFIYYMSHFMIMYVFSMRWLLVTIIPAVKTLGLMDGIRKHPDVATCLVVFASGMVRDMMMCVQQWYLYGTQNKTHNEVKNADRYFKKRHGSYENPYFVSTPAHFRAFREGVSDVVFSVYPPWARGVLLMVLICLLMSDMWSFGLVFVVVFVGFPIQGISNVAMGIVTSNTVGVYCFGYLVFHTLLLGGLREPIMMLAHN